MRRFIPLAGATVVLVMAAVTWAQGPGPQKTVEKGKADAKPAALDQLIAEALKNNPDIRVAEAKVREVEAELSRTRMKVVSELSLLHGEIQAAQFAVAEAKARYERALKVHEQAKAISAAELDAAKLTLEKMNAELAGKQAKLPYLLGRQPGLRWQILVDEVDDVVMQKLQQQFLKPAASDDEFLRRLYLDLVGRMPTADETKDFLKLPEKDRREKWVERLLNSPLLTNVDKGNLKMSKAYNRAFVEKYWQIYLQAAESPLTDKLRKVLDSTVRMDVDHARPKQIFEYVGEKLLPGINLTVRAKPTKEELDVKLNQPVPVGAVLQFLEDELNVVFVLRDYGIVVVNADERLPPGAVRVIDFWKHGAKANPKAPTDPAKKSAVEPARGVIEKVDAKDPALVQISIGSDSGLSKGQSLYAYRLLPEPKFICRIEIVEVMPARSVGRLVGALKDSPQIGDQVSTDLAAK